MKGTILEKILAAKQLRIDAAKRATDLERLVEQARSVRNSATAHRFQTALSDRSRINVIAEFKRASPSKGVINNLIDPAEIARAYEHGRAAAISVLTEEDFFAGSLDDLRAVREASNLPILRKDFIIDEYQIYESAAAGADAILLIVSALTSERILRFRKLAQHLGMDVIVEVHDFLELETAIVIDAKIIGVNNRNLKTFEVSLDISRELIKHAPRDVVMIAESGLKTRDDLVELGDLGYSGFLIGETLMRSSEPGSELKKLTTEDTEFTGRFGFTSAQ